MRTIEFTVTAENDGMRIRSFLRSFGVSSAMLTKLKNSENGITVNGEFARTIDLLHTGDVLKINIENSGKMPAAVKMDVEIVYEDEDLVVFNKPPHIPVHESRHHIGDTLSNFAAYHLGESGAFRAVYRLDNGTSGLVLVAKNKFVAGKLAGDIKKDYYAVVKGIIEKEGKIDKPIARCCDSIIKRQVDENGENAVTYYYPVKVKDGNTLVRLRLETGRTHQIRVHMSYLGYPLIGDTLYGEESVLISRQALHCKDIYFTHPVTEKEIHLTCDYPTDMKNLI
ncbi:MAG: RluA family pseudouridine synthase [Eubacterium sp.]|nr:RluA family pseudouridine synthase [Eubacterium sp.]